MRKGIALMVMLCMTSIPIPVQGWEFKYPFLLRLENTVARGLVQRDMQSVCTQAVYQGMCRHEYELVEKEFAFVQLILSIAATIPDHEEKDRLVTKAYQQFNSAWQHYSDVGKGYPGAGFATARQ